MVHHTALGKQCDCVKQLVDGIAWLVDGHHHYTVVRPTKAERKLKMMQNGFNIVNC